MANKQYENPFVFGRIASQDTFTDREKDTERLVANFTHGINSILISPRRWGKTSLVKKAMKVAESKTLKLVYIDIFSCKSDQDFYDAYASAIISQTSSKVEDWVKAAKEFLIGVSPVVTVGPDPVNDIKLSFTWSDKKSSEKSVLNLAEEIAIKKKIDIVVCIDEFQQIAEFPDSQTFQKKLRGSWQQHHNASYCLFGSKKHLMSGLFDSASKPFYQFGDMMFLQKIDTAHWVPFLCEQFAKTSKSISEDLAAKVCETVENHSSSVQQFAWNIWFLTTKEVTEDIFNAALDSLLSQNSVLYYNLIDSATEYQKNLLKALADGVTEGFYSAEVISKYNMVTSANVAGAVKALIAKDILDKTGNQLSINDPVFKIWIKRNL